MAEGYAMTKEIFNMTLDTIEKVKRLPPTSHVPQQRPAQPFVQPIVKGKLYRNDAGEEIPAYSCIAIEDVVNAANDRDVCKATKPSTTFRRSYAITNHEKSTPGPPGRYGLCTTCEPWLAKYDEGTPANDETWGPKPGQWTLSKGYPGFRVLGVWDTERKLALVVPEPIVSLVGKADGAITASDDETPGSGTVSVYVRPSSDLVDSMMNVTALNIGGEIAADTLVHLKWYAGAWWVVQTGLGYDRCKAVVKGAFTSANSTFTVDNVVATRGTSPLDDPEDMTEELTAQNTFGWDGDDDATVFIEWDQDAEQWVAYQVECSS